MLFIFRAAECLFQTFIKYMSFTTINLIHSASDFRGDPYPDQLGGPFPPLDLETLLSRFHVSQIDAEWEGIGGEGDLHGDNREEQVANSQLRRTHRPQISIQIPSSSFSPLYHRIGDILITRLSSPWQSCALIMCISENI